MQASVATTWPDDLLLAYEDTHSTGQRAISVVHTRDQQVIDTVQAPIGALTREAKRRARGENAGRLVIAENSDLVEVMARSSEFRGASLVDISDLRVLLGNDDPSDLKLADHGYNINGLQPAALELYAEFQHLYRSALQIDPQTLQLIVRLGSGTDWSLHAFFVEVERSARRQMSTMVTGAGGINVADLPTVTRPLPDPLPANPRQDPIDPYLARAALSEGGALAGSLDHFESRPSQIQMLETVTTALNDGGHALVEAGTGTGKSFAYLVPAALYAALNNRRVVISTNTINLQDQLFLKDVPHVLDALGLDIRAAVIKGRSNYLCLRRWWQLLSSDNLSEADRTLLIKTLLWLPRTETGDRVELRLSPAEEQSWSRLCAVPEACTPLRCQYHRAGVCFLARARRTAEASHLVIINHALLLTDTLNQAHVLPDFDHLIIDEGHHLEDEATSQLGWTVTGRELLRHLDTLLDSSSGPGTLRAAIEISRQAGSALTVAYSDGARSIQRCRSLIDDLVNILNDVLTHHGQTGDGGQTTLRVTEATRAQPDWSHVEIAWDGLLRALNGLSLILTQVSTALEQHVADREDADEVAGMLAAESLFWEVARIQLHRALGEGGNDPITWLTRGRGDELSMSLAPLEVGETLARCVFRTNATVIVTSATLTTAGQFQFVRGRIGLEDCAELQVPSPFDYARTTLVCAPADIPEPNQPNYRRSVEWVIERVASRMRGRTMALFTSHSQLRATYEAIHDALSEQGILVLGQGIDAASRDALLQTFRARQPAVLLGTNSFWEGVDVVGDTLSCVIIPRLPFSVPTDPVFQARSELFENPFRDYAVPQAVLRFRQGFGRLIRSQRDRGALLILDRRVLSKFYGNMFLKSLPDAQLNTGSGRRVAETIEQWLASDGLGV
jgi:predicted DnaQ family exonuclease/DinG family helicase